MTSTPPIPPVQPTAYQQQTFVATQAGRQMPAGLSIAALVMGILALIPVLGFFVAWLGLLFGIVALTKKRAKPGLAITGIVLSGLSILATPLIVSIMLPSISRARGIARQTVSMTNLNGIGKAIELYAAENNDQYPAELSQLIEEGTITKKTLYYPGKEEWGVAYCYLAPAQDAPGETIMACEKVGLHDNGRNVLSADGHVQRMTNDEFAKALAKPANAKFAKALKRAEGP